MTKTTNYQLNQWDASDYVRRTDFNEDNAKIESALGGITGLCGLKFTTGSYTGTGTYGEKKKNTLTFIQRPTLVLLIGSEVTCIPGTTDSGAASPLSQYSDFSEFTWSGNTLSWYANYAAAQMNTEGSVYKYIAVYLNL